VRVIIMDEEVERLEATLPAINDQKLATVLNAFAAQTVKMLNRVSSAAEGKLAKAEARLREAETSARLLEATLGAARAETTAVTVQNDVEDVHVVRERSEEGASSDVSEEVHVAVSTSPRLRGDEDAPAFKTEERAAPEQPETNAMTNDPVYGKYFKMIKMGVPTQAVRNKMTLDGVDASVLDGRVGG
jgi:WASH complex subunit CCDC53